MKKENKKNIVIISSLLLLTIATITFSYAAFAGKSQLTSDKVKYEDMLKHDKIEKENIEKIKNQTPEIPDEKALSEDPPNYNELGVFDASDIQLPLPTQEAKKYIIVTAGLSQYNGIYTGNSVDDQSEGIIINRYERVKSGDVKTHIYKIPATGMIILTDLSDDNKTFEFKTETGKTGTFDVTDNKGKYTIY